MSMSMQKLAVERSIWIAAPQERVWEAVTDPEQIAQWFLPSTLGAIMKRDDTGKISVSMGEMALDFAILDVVDPPSRVISRSLPDKLVSTAYRLEEEKDGTRITVTLSGFESLPEDARHERFEPSGTAWEQALENLKAYINGTERPFPYTSIASLCGYWRETREQIAVERSIWIAVPRERVWRAITDPGQVEKWFSPGTQWGGTGLHVGGRLYVVGPDNTEMYVQVIDLVEPPHRLVTRSQVEPPEKPEVTDWKLQEENGGTRLTLTYTGYQLDDAHRGMFEQHAFGFGMMLENLQASVEGKTLPYPGGF